MEQPRLTPAMSSRKAMVLDFVTAYISAHNGFAPSYGEIGAGCGICRERARELVTALVAKGHLRRIPGRARGLSLPTAVDGAVRLLEADGWRVFRDAGVARAPGEAMPLTFSTLPMLSSAAQIAGGDGGSGDDGAGADRG